MWARWPNVDGGRAGGCQARAGVHAGGMLLQLELFPTEPNHMGPFLAVLACAPRFSALPSFAVLHVRRPHSTVPAAHAFWAPEVR